MTIKNIAKLSALSLALMSASVLAANTAQWESTATRAHQLPFGAVAQQALPAATPHAIEVSLKLRNERDLDAFIAASHDRYSANYGRLMSTAEFMANHAPSQKQVDAVIAHLKASGYQHIEVSGNRMMVSAEGTVGNARTAFQVDIRHVQLAGRNDAYANMNDARVPASLRDTVQAVLGLQNVTMMHTFQRRVDASADFTPQALHGIKPTAFSTIYGGTGVPTAAGIPVGIIADGNISATLTHLKSFATQNGLGTIATQSVVVGKPGTDTAGVGEWDLDSQDIVGMGGGQVGKIVFYISHSLNDAQISKTITKAVSDNTVKIINVSLGECETIAKNNGSMATMDAAFKQAVAQGQTFSVSSGDSGADECNDGGKTPSFPASSPYVVSVGGTALTVTSANAYTSESVWSGGGGSPSTLEPKPTWQTKGDGVRDVPDISFDASPSSGALVITTGGTQQIGGTSLSAPIFAGAWARLLAAHPGLGFAGPYLYTLPASAYHDVTTGNNGGETAAVGWDYATGFGSFNLSVVNSNIH